MPDLLRTARMVASRLKRDADHRWIERELHGYPKKAAVPKYRVLKGELRAFNPFNGMYIPVSFDNPKLQRDAATVHFRPSIGNLYEIVTSPKTDWVKVNFSEEQLSAFRRMDADPAHDALVPFRRFAKSQINGIFDAVRNRLLDWTLTLTKKDAPVADTESDEWPIVGVGMPMGTDESEEVFAAISDECERLELFAARVDLLPGSARIATKFRKILKNAAIMVLDLSGSRPAVLIEVGGVLELHDEDFTIIIAKDGTPIPSNISERPVLFFKSTENLRKKIRPHLEAMNDLLAEEKEAEDEQAGDNEEDDEE